jgi:hypothetical protein
LFLEHVDHSLRNFMHIRVSVSGTPHTCGIVSGYGIPQGRAETLRVLFRSRTCPRSSKLSKIRRIEIYDAVKET